MKSLVDAARDQPLSRIVGLYDQIKALGSRLNLLYTRRFFPMEIGVHRFNRETEMISGQHSMQIWNDIDSMGFCADLVKDATAFEEPPSRINEKEFIQKCETDALLVTPAPGTIEVSTVACSHFSQAMRNAVAELPHDNVRLCANGRLSVSTICRQFPLMKPLFDMGIEFNVWKSVAEDLYPNLPDIAQRALNAKFQSQRGIDCFQLFGRASMMWNSPSTKAQSDQSAYVLQDIMKGSPLFDANEVSSIVECARKYGGKKGANSKALSDFVAAFKPPKRTVSAATWHALANLKWPAAKLPPNFIISILMALAGAPKC